MRKKIWSRKSTRKRWVEEEGEGRRRDEQKRFY